MQKILFYTIVLFSLSRCAVDLPNIDFSLSNPVVISISSQKLEKELFK